MSIHKEDWSKLIPYVSKAAPVIGSVLAGPAGGIIGTLIAGVFGANSSNMQDIIEKIQESPNAAAKLQELEMTHEETLKKLANEKYQMQIEDRKDARKNNKDDFVVHFMALGYGGIYAFLVTIDAFGIIEINDTVMVNLLGITMIIINYYFGSGNITK